MRAYVEVVRKDGTSQRLPLVGNEVIVGRSANVGISLPNEPELELEHLLLLPRGGDGCWVSVAEGSAVPVTLGGKRFESGIVKWGTDLRVGSLTLRIATEEAAGAKAKLLDVHPALLVAALAAAGFVLWTFLDDKGVEASIDSGRSQKHIALFGDATTCSSDAPLDAATRLEGIAHTRGDRYVYDPRDGVRAVDRYLEAASCYKRAGATDDAERMLRDAADLKERVESDYAASRLNLSHAIETKNWSDAAKESKRLLLFTEHAGENDYVTWLVRVHRQVAVKASHD